MFKNLLFICCVSILAACGGSGGTGGGGGGGGSSSTGNSGGGNSEGAFTLSQTTANFSGDVSGMDTSQRPASVDIQGSLQNASGTVYLAIDKSQTNLISDVDVIFSDTQAKGTLTLIPVSQNLLVPGTYTGNVIIHACKDQNCIREYSGSPKTIKINYTVTGPDYEIASNQVNFRMAYNNELPKPVSINMTSSRNVFSNFAGTLVKDDARKWLDIAIAWNEKTGTATFNVTKQLPPGTYTTSVDLYAHSMAIRKSVNVTLVVDPEPFTVSNDDFRFILNGSKTIANQKRSVTVAGTSQSWNINADVDWINFSQSSGASGQTVDIALNDNAKQLSAGLHTGFIFIKTPGDTSQSRIPVSIYVNSVGNTSSLQEYKLEVKNSVVDTQRSKVYVVDSTSQTLYFIDLKSGAVEKYFKFADTPDQLYITKNRSKLYLSLHVQNDSNTSIVEIDLENQTVLSRFLIDIYAGSFVVTNNNKLIATAGSGQWSDVNSYEVPTGKRTGNVYGIYAGGKLKLDASENYVYGLQILSPSDLIKFDISGTGIRMATSIHASEIAFNFWMNPGSSLLITSYGELFTSAFDRGARILNQGETFISMDAKLSNNTMVATANRYTGIKLITLSDSFTILSETSIEASGSHSIHIVNDKTYLIYVEEVGYFDKFLKIKSI